MSRSEQEVLQEALRHFELMLDHARGPCHGPVGRGRGLHATVRRCGGVEPALALRSCLLAPVMPRSPADTGHAYERKAIRHSAWPGSLHERLGVFGS